MKLAAVLEATGLRLDPASVRPVGGGCIHEAWRVDGPGGPLFLKTHAATSDWMLAAEADGLAALATAGCLRVPAVRGQGVTGGTAWLALEWLELRTPSETADATLGAALARQHLAGGPHFGWHADNALGATLQPNTPNTNWSEFFAAHRLGWQLELGARNGFPRRLLATGERLRQALPALLESRRVEPALLHGDLWSGNRAADPAGHPVVFDPAVHYGDPECDLAMALLFGGFAPAFFAAYDAVLPPAPGRTERLRLYQLYHVLNHANLFGGSYLRQAQSLIDALT